MHLRGVHISCVSCLLTLSACDGSIGTASSRDSLSDRAAPDVNATLENVGNTPTPQDATEVALGFEPDGDSPQPESPNSCPDTPPPAPQPPTPQPPAPQPPSPAPQPDDPCPGPVLGDTYTALEPASAPTDRPAPMHADLNLKLRSWTTTTLSPALFDPNGQTDSHAPNLKRLLDRGDAKPELLGSLRVGTWDWGCNCRTDWIADPDVTLLKMKTSPGELVFAPKRNVALGTVDIGGVSVTLDSLVLYVDDDSVTLKYTSEDNVVTGYTIHIIGVAPAHELCELYRTYDTTPGTTGYRAKLPALRVNQAIGRATGDHILVSIRDNGKFMDPRSRKDWWQ